MNKEDYKYEAMKLPDQLLRYNIKLKKLDDCQCGVCFPCVCSVVWKERINKKKGS